MLGKIIGAVVLPPGCTSATGVLRYTSTYRDGSRLTGGTVAVSIVGGQIKAADGTALNNIVLPGVGDPVAPPLELSYQPTDGPANSRKLVSITLRPSINSGTDTLDIGKADPSAPIVASPAMIATFADTTAQLATLLPQVQTATALVAQLGDQSTGLAALTASVAGLVVQVDGVVTSTGQATALALTAAGIQPRDNLAAITGADGYYRAMDTGRVYQRSGGANTPRPDLEALNQDGVTARLISATLDALGVAPGRVAGDSKLYLGRTYFWQPDSTEAVDPKNPTVMQVVGGGVGRWILADREWGLNLKWFAYLVVNGDWIPAINAALVIGSVYLPPGLYPVKPSASNFITVPVGVSRTLSGSGADSILKVADGTGDYGKLIGQGAGTVTNLRLTRFRLDQNPDNNTGAVVTGDVNRAQFGVALNDFDGVDIDQVTFGYGTGVNTINLSGANCKRATVRNCSGGWARNTAQPVYDNSFAYFNCYDHQFTGNTLTARSVLDGARGAVESHGAQSVIFGNTITNFREGINLVTFSGGSTDTNTTSSLICTDNTLIGGCIGIRLWPITGKTLRNVSITNNTIVLSQGQWGETANVSLGGILTVYDTGGSLNGDIDGLLIAHNTVEFDPTEARTTGLAYAAFAGIGLTGNGNASNVRIYGNSVKNAPFWAYELGRAGKTLTNLRMANNVAYNSGTATGHSPAAARVPMALQGLITNARIGSFAVIEDTAAPLATALLFTSLTAGSSVVFETLPDITAPNNPALVIPVPPAGVSFETPAKLSVAQNWTAKQTVTVSGARAIDGISDTLAGVYGKSTSGPGVYGISTSGFGVQGISTQTYALLAQQLGSATANLGGAGMTALIQRTLAATTYNITAPTLVVDDAATVTTGNRYNPLAEFRWGGVARFTVSGAFEAMGAGIITAGGWGRASVALTPGAIAAGTTWDSADIAVTGAALGDVVSVSPAYVPAAGLTWCAFVSSVGNVRVRIANPTAAAITPTAAATWKLAVFRS